MSSNVGNQEAGENAAEREAESLIEEPGADDPIQSESSEDDVVAVEIEQLLMKLREVEEKKVEAERQVLEFSERFKHAQSQLRTETEEQRLRMQRNFDQRLEMAKGDLVAGLLDTLDNLKRAVAAADKSHSQEKDFKSLIEGVRATANMFEAKMQEIGLVPVQSLGEEFNPEIHEAVEMVSAPPSQDNRVLEEYQTGYKFGDRLLRPARVRVGRAE